MCEVLYRGLREEEYALGRLIPKGQGKPEQHPKLPRRLPFTLGETIENGAINHQKEIGEEPQGSYLTSGVSCTTSYEIAKGWATTGAKKGYVAVINCEILDQYGIDKVDVSALPEVINPADKEIILYGTGGAPLPAEIIVRIDAVQP